MTIGQNIKRIRKEKEITQKKLSELTNIAEVTIRKYEAEKFIPKVPQVERIAKGLGVTPFELIESSYFYIKKLSDYSTKELLEELERRCSK